MILISDPELVYWTYWEGEPDMVAILDPELHGPDELEGLHGGLDDAPFPHPLDPGEHCVVGVGLGAEDGDVNEVLVVDVLEQAHW